MKALQIVELAIVEAFLLVEASGQTISDVENAVRDPDNVIAFASIQVSSESGATALHEWIPYSRKSDGPFRTFALSRLSGAFIDPQPAGFGFENDEYTASVSGDGNLTGRIPSGNTHPSIVSFASRKFRLVKTETGYALPPEAFDLKGDYSGAFLIPAPRTLTNYEVFASLGGTNYVFSTFGGGTNELPRAGGTCATSTVQSYLKSSLLLIDRIVSKPSIPWDSIKVVLWEGTKATTIVFPKVTELPRVRLSISLDEGVPYLTVSGEDAADVEIEEGPTLRGPWGPSISLLRPPKPSSLTVGEFVFPIVQDGPVRFYRPKAPYAPAVQ